MIYYRHGVPIAAPDAIDLYQRSGLGDRRPIHDVQAFEAMLAHGNLIVSAWHGEQLVDIARTLTDFAYVAYLADLAVDRAYQRQGIGKQLIQETRARLGAECKVVVLAAPQAHGYYEALGFEQHPRAWTLRNGAGAASDLSA